MPEMPEASAPTFENLPEHMSKIPKMPPAALGLGLCDERNILSDEERDSLSKDLHILYLSRAGIRSVEKQELID